MAIATINPTTGETLKTFAALSDAEVDARLQAAAVAFAGYRRTTFAARSRMMARAAEILEQEKASFGRLMTLEMGKPFKAAVAEATKCAWACRYYAEHAERMLADETVQTEATRSYVHCQPLGPVLAIMPWNFPFWQVIRFAAPALMAGNVGLLKHASNVPQCALALEDLFRRAGFPDGVFQTLLIGSERVASVLADPRIRAATLTGSTPAGSQVASEAGRHIKKTVLELGGSDPFVVMPSTDLDGAADAAVSARIVNNGQSCIAAKRFIVHESIAEAFQQRFVQRLQALRVGDPMDEATDVGPLATLEILERVEQQVGESVAMGARVLTGGQRLDRPGYFCAPTALADIPADSPAYREEVFAPVALLFRVPDIEAAIHLANDTSFGLGASAWTNDRDEQMQFVEGLDAGMVFINGQVASDPRLPFGGVKGSGYGRELSHYGIHEFVNIKTVWIKEGQTAAQPRIHTE